MRDSLIAWVTSGPITWPRTSWGFSNAPGRAGSVALAIEIDFSPSNRRSDDRNDG